MEDNFFSQFGYDDTEADPLAHDTPSEGPKNFFSAFSNEPDADQIVTKSPPAVTPPDQSFEEVPGVGWVDQAYEKMQRDNAERKRKEKEALDSKRGDSFLEGLTDPQQYGEFAKGIVPGAVRFAGTTFKGAAGIQSSSMLASQKDAQRQIDIFDSLDRGEQPSDTTGFEIEVSAYQNMTPEQRLSYRKKLEGFASPVTPTQERTLFDVGKGVTDYAKTLLPADPAYREAVGRQLGEGIGSMIAALPAVWLGTVPAAVFFGAGGSGEAVERAVQQDKKLRQEGKPGLTEDQIATAALWGIGPGVTDVAPVELLLGRMKIPKPFQRVFANAIGRIGGQAFIEGLQESGQQFLQNLIAQEVYNPDQSLKEGIIPNAEMGAGVGGIAATAKELVTSFAGGRRRGGSGTPPPAGEPAQPDLSIEEIAKAIDNPQEVARETKQDKLEVQQPVEGGQESAPTLKPLENGFFEGPEEGTKFRVSPQVASTGGGILFETRTDSNDVTGQPGRIGGSYISEDGNLTPVEYYRAGPRGTVADTENYEITEIWKPKSEAARADAVEILYELGQSAPDRSDYVDILDRLQAVVRADIAGTYSSEQLVEGAQEAPAGAETGVVEPEAVGQPKGVAPPQTQLSDIEDVRQWAREQYGENAKVSRYGKQYSIGIETDGVTDYVTPDGGISEAQLADLGYSQKTEEPAAELAPEQQAYEQENILPAIEEIDAEVGSPILADAYSRLTPDEKTEIISRISENEEDIADLIEEIAIRNEDVPTIAAMAIRRGLNDEQIAQVRQILQQSAPELASGFDELIASLPKPKQAKPRNAAAPVSKAGRNVISRLEGISDQTELRSTIDELAPTLKADEWKSIGFEVAGRKFTSGKQAREAVYQSLSKRSKGTRGTQAEAVEAPAPTFSQRVQEIANKVQTGFFTEESSIAQVYDEYGKLYPDAGTLDEFKNRLMDANRSRELTLYRLDDPQSIDAETRNRSLIEARTPDGRTVRFHFVAKKAVERRAPVQERTEPDRMQLRRQFADILNSRTPKSKWASSLGIDEAQLDPMIEEAIRKGFLRRDKNGNVRRVPKSQRSGSFAAMAIPENLPETMAGEGDVALTPEAEEVWPEAKAAINRSASAILPEAVSIDVRDNIVIATLRKEDQMLALREEAAFRAWFGNSQIVDERGEPMVVYHGSGVGGIEIFDPTKSGSVKTSDWGTGIYFSPSESSGDYYRTEALLANDPEGDKLLKAYEDRARELGTRPMHEAIDLGLDSDGYKELQKLRLQWVEHRDNLRRSSQSGQVYAAYLSLQNPMIYKYEGITDPYLSEIAKEQGHDGIIIVNELPPAGEPLSDYMDEIIAFEPTQIKSVDNRGTFDPTDPRISYALRKTKPSESAIDEQEGETRMDDYRGQHSAPNVESGSPIHDVTLNGIYPSDFYSANGLRYYGTGSDEFDYKAYQKVLEFRDKPDEKIAVWRAIPRVEGRKNKASISSSYTNPGDWVTIVRGYAVDHGESALNGEYNIVKRIVRAGDLFTAGDSFLEWGWSPPDARQEQGEVASPPSEPREGSLSLEDREASQITDRLDQIATDLNTLSTGAGRFMKMKPAERENLRSELVKERQQLIEAYRNLPLEARARNGQDQMLDLNKPSQEQVRAAKALQELTNTDEAFAYPKSDKQDIADIIGDVAAGQEGFEYQGSDELGYHEHGANRMYNFLTSERKPFHVYEDDSRVWIDVSEVKEGQAGSAIYAAVANYAYNTGRKFIGDPDGMSAIALRRRTENMLSSALKFGTTDHLEPHEDQIAGNEKIGVPPLQWTEGDTLGNIASLMEVSIENVASKFPEIKDYRYDLATGTIRTGEGQPVSLDELAKMARGSAEVRASRAGGRTLARVVLQNTLLQGARGEEGAGLLGEIVRRSAQQNQPGALSDGIFYAASRQAEALGRNAPQILTPEFRNWFKDSKVVDENGRPMVVYHGTDQVFEEFSREKMGASTGAESATGGFFFTDNPVIAGQYASLATEVPSTSDAGENIIPTYLKIENPFIVDMEGRSYAAESDSITSIIFDAKQAGHDGVIIRNFDDSVYQEGATAADHYIVFDPTQIKSAIGNRGTFDPTDPSIINAMRRQEQPQALGQTDPYTMSISIAMRAVEAEAKAKGVSTEQEAVRVLRHEAVEFFKAMGLFTEKEWNVLKSAAKRNGWVETTGVRDAYESIYKGGMSDTEMNDLLIKEAIAEQYSEFHLGKKQFKGVVQQVFQRIKDFITSTANWMKGEGFQTWDDVFSSIDQGEFKARFEEAFPEMAPEPATGTRAIQATAGKIADSQARQPSAGTERPTQSLADIVNSFNRALGLTVRQGRLDPGLKRRASMAGQDVRGQTSMETGVVRLRVPNEIDTLAHEGGHALENRFKGDLEAIKQAHAAELTPLASPGPDALSEGFAEFFRRYVTNPKAATRVAPNFEQAFEDFLDAQDPAMLASLQSIRDGYREWIKAPSGGAVASSIATTVAPGSTKEIIREFKEEGLRNTFQNWTDRIYTAIFDDLHPMWLAVDGLLEIAKKNVKPSLRKNLDVKATDNAYKLLRLARDGYAAGHMDLLHGVHDYKSITPTGPSLRDAIATAFGGFDKSQWNEEISTDFGAYLVSRRMVQEWARFQNGDISAPPDKFSLADHQQAIKDFEAKYPGFKQGAQQVHEYLNNMLRKKRDAGLITSELYDELVGRQDYVPVMRDMSDRGGVEGRSAARKDKYSIISRFRGSQRDVINPLESIAKDSYETAMIIARNDALKALDALARAAGPDGGRFAERIPSTEMKATQVNVQEAIKAASKSAGIDPADMQIMLQAVDDQLGDNTVAQIWRAGEISEKGEAIVYLWESGNRIPIRLADGKFGHDMLHAVTGLNREATDWWVNLLSLPSTGLRIGVTASLDFIGANFLRDQVSAWVLTRDFVPFYDGARGIYNDLNMTDVSRIYSRVGGIMGGANVAAQHESRIKREILQLRRKGIKFTLNPLTRDFWRMTEFSETGTRLAVFEKAFDRAKTDGLTDWESAVEASFIARDYIDFGRRGSRMLAARKLVPFLNAALQGLDRGIRGLRGRVDADKVLRTVISPYIKSRTGQPLSEVEQGNVKQAAQAWGYMVALGMVGLGLSLLYRDDEEYEEISDYIKATHWLIRLDGQWVRIPKPFELAFFSNLVERTFDYTVKDDPTAVKRFVDGLFEITVPPHSIPGVAVTTELATDYNFFTGRSIVGPFLKTLPPELQFNAYASEFSKYLGKQVGISPAYIDHFITGFGASYGREFVNASDQFMPAIGQATGGMFGLPTEPVADPAINDYFFIRRFTTDPKRGSTSVRQFWDMMGMTNGTFVQAANGYRHLVDKVRDARGAQEFLERLPKEERAYALLKAGNSGNRAKYRRLHPLERAKEIVSVTGGMKKEINLNRLYKGGDGKQIELTPQQMRTVSDLLSDISMREARNALIALKTRGWAQKKPIEVDKVYEEMKAAAPEVHKELVDRLKSKKLPSYIDVVKGWPIARERILEDGQKAIISDLYRRDFSIGEGVPLQ